jgi:hypothetical protein
MKLTFEKKQDKKGSVVASLVVHVIAIVLIASITFTYPLSSFFGEKENVPVERIQYVRVVPRGAPAAVGNGSQEKTPPKKAEKPAPLLAPSVIPSALPPIPPPNVSVGAISGTGTGSGGAAAGIATGIEPSLPDSRIELRPNMLRLPLSLAQKNDSAVKAIYLAYRQAEIEAAANKGRSPRDWTFEKGGQKYGLDSSYIYLGKFKLPSAILAALPFNTGGVDGRRIIDNRNAEWIRNDIYTHAQGMSEDDFRAAIRRIRERKDREKREAEEARGRVQPIVP